MFPQQRNRPGNLAGADYDAVIAELEAGLQPLEARP